MPATTSIIGLLCPTCGRERDWRTRAAAAVTCYRCRRGLAPEAPPNQQIFNRGVASRSKRAVQRDFYNVVAAAQLHRPRVLVLPGRAPRYEITKLRAVLPTVQITAFDRDPGAVRAAMTVGVDRAVCGELTNIDNPRAPEFLTPGTFDVVNLDLCSNIPGTNRWHARGAWDRSIVTKAARLARRFLMTFVAYSHEEFERLRHPLAAIERFNVRVAGQLPLPQIATLDSKLQLRVLALWAQTWEQGFTPVRVYSYRGRRLPMLAVAFTRARAPWAPFFVNHHKGEGSYV